jgi:hypothetical protein
LNGGYIPTNYSLSESGMIKKKSFPLPLTSWPFDVQILSCS